MEEVGEVSSCIRKLREKRHSASKSSVEDLTNDLEREIADVISWAMSAISKIDYVLGAGVIYRSEFESSRSLSRGALVQTAGLELSGVLWQSYKNKDGDSLFCPVCENRPCTCTAAPL